MAIADLFQMTLTVLMIPAILPHASSGIQKKKGGDLNASEGSRMPGKMKVESFLGFLEDFMFV